MKKEEFLNLIKDNYIENHYYIKKTNFENGEDEIRELENCSEWFNEKIFDYIKYCNKQIFKQNKDRMSWVIIDKYCLENVDPYQRFSPFSIFI